MENRNPCIGCSVDSCKHRCSHENYCSLDKIEVGQHEYAADTTRCTDCRSYEKK